MYVLVETVGLVGAELEGVDVLPVARVALGHVLVQVVVARLDVVVPVVETLLHAVDLHQVVLVHLAHVVDRNRVAHVREVRERALALVPARPEFEGVVALRVCFRVEVESFGVHSVIHQFLEYFSRSNPQCVFEFSLVDVILSCFYLIIIQFQFIFFVQ